LPLPPATGADWWKRAVFYQVYPRSFADSNGDGIGDLPGLLSRLDYLNDGTAGSLGVDAIWLTPVFPSPMKDFGYDVADYVNIDPVFGSIEDINKLVVECHRRGVRVLLDWVPNHTSDQHPWFRESRGSRVNPKRNWYVWSDPAPGGGPPNNWPGVFGGAAWTFDEPTGQYYLHSFLPEQPDLNWRNPEVVDAMHETLRFWLRLGVDGFRLDAVGRLIKHPELADASLSDGPAGEPLADNHNNYPEVYETLRDIRAVFDEFPNTVAIGESFGTPDEIRQFYGGAALDGLHLAFNFGLIQDERQRGYIPWDAARIREIVTRSWEAMPEDAVSCWALNNHDRGRFVSRHDSDGRGAERARAAALLLLGLPGVPVLYQGEELGMPNVEVPPGQLQDPARFHIEGRDPMRTPMQWDTTEGRGFTTGQPWLPFGPLNVNVAAEDADRGSMLWLYRDAIRIRREHPPLFKGDFTVVDVVEDVFAFVRRAGDERLLVAVNTATEPRTFTLPPDAWTMLLASKSNAASLEGSELRLEALAGCWLAAR
jgi:alpha-glucosidase